MLSPALHAGASAGAALNAAFTSPNRQNRPRGVGADSDVILLKAELHRSEWLRLQEHRRLIEEIKTLRATLRASEVNVKTPRATETEVSHQQQAEALHMREMKALHKQHAEEVAVLRAEIAQLKAHDSAIETCGHKDAEQKEKEEAKAVKEKAR